MSSMRARTTSVTSFSFALRVKVIDFPKLQKALFHFLEPIFYLYISTKGFIPLLGTNLFVQIDSKDAQSCIINLHKPS